MLVNTIFLGKYAGLTCIMDKWKKDKSRTEFDYILFSFFVIRNQRTIFLMQLFKVLEL